MFILTVKTESKNQVLLKLNKTREKMQEKKTIILGSRNRNKGIEMNEILGPSGFIIKTLADFPEVPEVIEDGSTFMENAEKKAVQTATYLGHWVLAEDSGLCVDALKGAPGIFSARFAGDHGDEKNNDLLLEKLGDLPLEKRSAHYTCAMVLSDPDGNVHFKAEGYCNGKIGFSRRGSNGFGYDPLFIVDGYEGKTFGELPPEVKKEISHRARAAKQFLRVLSLLYTEEI